MTSIPDAVIWKFGPVVSFRGDEIIDWRHPTMPQPSPAEIAAAVAEYQPVETLAVARQQDIMLLRNATGDAIVLLVRMIQRLMVSAPTLLKPADFSPAVRQAYQDAKAIADRLDPPP